MDQDSRESGLNGDGDKQILAPSEGPRENLINTAIKFLQNPKVMTSPLYQKKAFLEKKGLTQEEIQLAIERAGVPETTSAAQSQAGPPAGYQPGGMSGVPAPVYAPAPIPPQSRWARTRDLAMTTVIVAGVSYGIYQLFERYLRPLVFGKSAQERRMERLEGQILEIQKSVADSLAEMTRTLSVIQTSLQNPLPQYNSNNDRGITDLKSDIASLKGLLLSRNQFPPAPTTSMMLPSWQRAPTSTTTPTVSKSESATSGTTEYQDNSLSPSAKTAGKDDEMLLEVNGDDSKMSGSSEGREASLGASEVLSGTDGQDLDSALETQVTAEASQLGQGEGSSQQSALDPNGDAL